MIRQILPNNNEKCYSNLSATFRESNPPHAAHWALAAVLLNHLLIAGQWLGLAD
jgi:hypothetical protein